jgi:hypothetical protein
MIQQPEPRDTNMWKQHMIRHIQVPDQHNIKQVLEDPDSSIYLVSDGGVHNYNGNYGVVLAQSATILATTMGKRYIVEFHESSNRAKLHGMLAGLVLLTHIIDSIQINIPQQKTFNMYCDNKAVINTIISPLDVRRTVNQHRHPDN